MPLSEAPNPHCFLGAVKCTPLLLHLGCVRAEVISRIPNHCKPKVKLVLRRQNWSRANSDGGLLLPAPDVTDTSLLSACCSAQPAQSAQNSVSQLNSLQHRRLDWNLPDPACSEAFGPHATATVEGDFLHRVLSGFHSAHLFVA